MIEELKLSDNDIDSQGIYANFTPIAALNLPDWRNTEKQLVRRLDWTLIPVSRHASIASTVHTRSCESGGPCAIPQTRVYTNQQ